MCQSMTWCQEWTTQSGVIFSVIYGSRRKQLLVHLKCPYNNYLILNCVYANLCGINQRCWLRKKKLRAQRGFSIPDVYTSFCSNNHMMEVENKDSELRQINARFNAVETQAKNAEVRWCIFTDGNASYRWLKCWLKSQVCLCP